MDKEKAMRILRYYDYIRMTLVVLIIALLLYLAS